MSEKPFHYQDPFPLGPDATEYVRISSDHVSVSDFDGKPILRIEPEALSLLANEAFKAINFTLRPAHLEQVAGVGGNVAAFGDGPGHRLVDGPPHVQEQAHDLHHATTTTTTHTVSG